MESVRRLWNGVGTREGPYRTLVVVDNVTQMVASAVVRLADAHGVVGEEDIAIIACVVLEYWCRTRSLQMMGVQ